MFLDNQPQIYDAQIYALTISHKGINCCIICFDIYEHEINRQSYKLCRVTK